MASKNSLFNNLFYGWSLTAVLLLLGGIALRLYNLNAPLAGDELASASVWAQMPFWDIPFNYQNTNNHILNTLAIAVILKTFDLNHFMLRLPVLFLGVLSLILCYSTALKVTGDRRAAIGALLLLAINGTHIFHSTNARGYIYATSLAQLALYMLLAMFQYSHKGLLLPPERTLPPRGLLFLCMACALGAWAMPTFALFIGSILLFSGLSLLLKYRDKIIDFRFPHTQTIIALSGSLAFFFLQYYVLIPKKMRQEAFAFSGGLSIGEPLLSGILEHLINPCHSLVFGASCKSTYMKLNIC